MIRVFTLVGVLTLVGSVSSVSAEDREALVGTWKITTFQDDGRDRLDRLGVKAAKKGDEPRVAYLVFTKDACYLLRGDGSQELRPGLANAAWKSVTLDATTSPKSVDIVGFSGKDGDKEKTYLGIYEIDGSTLKICYCEQGKTRPSKFESDGAMNLFIAEKVSPEPRPLPKPAAK